jgi:hypothetical protein
MPSDQCGRLRSYRPIGPHNVHRARVTGDGSMRRTNAMSVSLNSRTPNVNFEHYRLDRNSFFNLQVQSGFGAIPGIGERRFAANDHYGGRDALQFRSFG